MVHTFQYMLTRPKGEIGQIEDKMTNQGIYWFLSEESLRPVSLLRYCVKVKENGETL